MKTQKLLVIAAIACLLVGASGAALAQESVEECQAEKTECLDAADATRETCIEACDPDTPNTPICRQGCRDDARAAKSKCRAAFRVCRAASRCDALCPEGQFCSDGVCVECVTDAACDDGESCIEGACVTDDSATNFVLSGTGFADEAGPNFENSTTFSFSTTVLNEEQDPVLGLFRMDGNFTVTVAFAAQPFSGTFNIVGAFGVIQGKMSGELNIVNSQEILEGRFEIFAGAGSYIDVTGSGTFTGTLIPGGARASDGFDIELEGVLDNLGACCLTDGTCELQTPFSCNQSAGVYQGDGTDCASATCESPE